MPIQLLPQFESNRIPHRGNLLIARQLDFRVAYGRRGTHRASRLRRRSSNQQRGRATKLTPRASAWQSRAITLLLRSPPTLQRTNIPLFVRKVFRIPSSKRRFLRDEGRFDVTGGGLNSNFRGCSSFRRERGEARNRRGLTTGSLLLDLHTRQTFVRRREGKGRFP